MARHFTTTTFFERRSTLSGGQPFAATCYAYHDSSNAVKGRPRPCNAQVMIHAGYNTACILPLPGGRAFHIERLGCALWDITSSSLSHRKLHHEHIDARPDRPMCPCRGRTGIVSSSKRLKTIPNGLVEVFFAPLHGINQNSRSNALLVNQERALLCPHGT
jgi:hypothetical protein